jgi:hypothetical protein
MTKDEALRVFRQTGALLEGHFIFWISLKVEAFDLDNLPPGLARIPALKPGSK